MLDTEKYTSKPKNAGAITNRIINHPVDIEPEDLIKEIASGKSFVPCSLHHKNGVIKRRIENWQSQQLICLDIDDGMTIDEALIEFKDSAMFIYTTFSHSDENHKFRVVMATNEPITKYSDFTSTISYWMNRYPMVDQSCKDGSRLFYGGDNIFLINLSNRIPIIYSDDSLEVFRPYNRITNNTNNAIVGSKNLTQVHSNNIELIKSKDIEGLQFLINPLPITFHTHEEVYEYLSRQDLRKFLGLYDEYFNCIFHVDNSPSASIYVNPKTNHFVYKCFSGNCTFKNGTIIKCVERILKCNRIQALRFLRKVYRINYYETDWQKEQKEILEENMRYIRSDQFEQDYPELHKRIKNYLGELYIIHSIAKDNLPAEHYTEDQINSLFFASVRHIEKLCVRNGLRRNEDLKSMANKLSLFTYLGLLFKLKEDDIPEILLKEAKRELMKKKDKIGGNIKLVSFFEIPSYSDQSLSFGEEKAIEFKDKHLTMRGWSYEMIHRVLGEDEASRVYPQLKGKELSERSKINTSVIEEVMNNILNEKGWVTEQQILEDIDLKKVYKEKQMKKALGEILDKYGLVRKRLNKDLKIKLNVNIDGYPFVMYREGKLHE